MKHFTRALCVFASLYGADSVRADSVQSAAGQSTAAPLRAACRFVQVANIMHLQADCTTAATIVVPEGVTLDGGGHRVTAVDPVGGSFEGAVVRNGGSEAHVRRLVIEASGLAAVCHASTPVDTRLRGILFDAASGSITDNQIVAVSQTGLPCQEGHGIDVRTPVGAASSERPSVLVQGNQIAGFQKTGILVLGDVDVSIYLNRVEGAGTLRNIAQNALQIGRGARGDIKWNQFSRVHYGGAGFSAVGLLVQDIDSPLGIAFNRVDETDVGIWLERTSNADVASNQVSNTSDDGVVVDGASGIAEANHVQGNRISAADAGILVFGDGASENVIEGNSVTAPADSSVVEVEGAHDNTLVRNVPLSQCTLVHHLR